MNPLQKLLVRKPVLSVLLLLLLALSIGFSSIGCAAWAGANAQLRQIDQFYTTIAVPTPVDPAWITQKTQDEFGVPYIDIVNPEQDYHWPSGDITYGKNSIAAVAEQAPQVKKSSDSGLLSARLLNCNGLASGTANASSYNVAFDFYTRNFCVLALKCLSIEDQCMIAEGALPEDPTGVTLSYGATFEVVEEVSLMDSYGDLKGQQVGIGHIFGGNTLPVRTTLFVGEDGSPLFEVGKTYIVRGFFVDLWYEQRWVNGGNSLEWVPTNAEDAIRKLCLSAAPLDGLTMTSDGNGGNVNLPGHPDFLIEEHFEHRQETNELVSWYGIGDTTIPYFTEYTGDLTAFLQSDAGKVWRETIIPWTELNQNSASVVLTDNIYSTYNFNSGTADILQGRVFSQAEYDSGADVCMVSAAFAQHNGLSLGDVIQLDYYNTGVIQGEGRYDGLITTTDYIYLRLPLTPENRINLQKEYEIIGIYTSPEFSLGQHNFPADTIFVPKASVPNAEAYEDPQVPYLNALILENGTQEAFAQYMADHDMADTYTFVDMSYEDTRPALETMAANAQRMMFIGLAVFLLVAGLYLFLLLRKTRPVSLSMRLLGVSQKVTWGQLLAAAVPLNLLAAVLGLALGAALFGSVTTAILSATVTFHWKPMLLCVGLETAAVLLVLLVTTAAQARAELMQKRRG